MAAIRTFLDSGVLLAAFKGDSQSHALAREIIDDANRTFLLSDMVRLEVMPKAVYHKQADEVAFYEEIFAAAETVAITDAAAMQRAFALASKYGLSAFDACIAESALALAADEFVTAEKPTKAFFRIEAVATKFTSIVPAA